MFGLLRKFRCRLGCCRFTHPGCNRLTHALLEGKAEGAVAPIAAVAGELLGNDGLLGCDSLAIEVDEVVDAEVVDISIVSDALTGEILTEIVAVGAHSLRQLQKRQVMLQIKIRSHTVLSQQLFDIGRR